MRSKFTCKSLLQLLLAISISWHDFTPLQYIPVVGTGVKSSLIIYVRGKLYGRILHE